MIERLDGRASIVVGALAVLVVVLIGWFGFIAPQRAKAAELEEQISRTQLQLYTTEKLINSSALEDTGRELARLRAAIPDEIGMSEILRQLTAASREAGVRLSGITPQAVVATGVASSVPIALTMEGRYFGLREFLRLLRTRAALEGDEIRAEGRLFSIESIQFGAGGEGGLVSATLNISAYAFSGAPQVPGASQPATTDAGTEAAGG